MSEAAQFFDQAAARYDVEFGDSSVWSIAHRVAGRLLNEHLEGGFPSRVLDAGCGTGKWGLPFVRGGASVTFADVSPNMLAEAVASAERIEPRAEVQSFCAPVETISSSVGTSAFDLTLCMGDPLSYCDDHVAAIEELVKVTRVGGTIFVSVDSRLGYLRVFKERDGYDLERLKQYLRSGNVISWENLPIHTFLPDELRSTFEKFGGECRGIWTLPTVSSYFLFDPPFQQMLSDEAFRSELTEIELDALRTEQSSPGSHHLYGLFVRSA